MTNSNTTQTFVATTYVVNTAKPEVKMIVTNKKKQETKIAAKPVAAFAKNTRYSIFGNAGGYTGL